MSSVQDHFRRFGYDNAEELVRLDKQWQNGSKRGVGLIFVGAAIFFAAILWTPLMILGGIVATCGFGISLWHLFIVHRRFIREWDAATDRYWLKRFGKPYNERR